MIVAASENGCIGKEGRLPWHIGSDLQHFKSLTQGKCVVMGRKTYESIGHPLKGRTNIILSRDKAYIPDHLDGETFVTVINDLDTMLHIARTGEVCIIGGAEIYRQFAPYADRIALTRVHAVIEDGDAFFEVPDGFTMMASLECQAGKNDDYGYAIETWTRAKIQ